MHVSIVVRFPKRFVQLLEHLHGDGVEFFWAVQGDAHPPVLFVIQDAAESGHDVCPLPSWFVDDGSLIAKELAGS